MKKIYHRIVHFVSISLVVLFMVILTGSATNRYTGTNTKSDPLPQALVADLEEYVVELMNQLDVPGVSMVLVQGDKIVFNHAYGVRDLETKEPVTPQTLFGIGSTTKSMTAIMIASLVDDGVIRWDTPLTDILPGFALSDPQVTAKMTVRHTLCMCSSVPDHKEAILVNYSTMTAEDVIEMLADVPLSGSVERTFNYSSPMVAAGGYLASLAAGGKYGQLEQGYNNLMQERIFGPLEMTSSTFSIAEAVASGNYATPHYSALDGMKPIAPEVEGIFSPIAPAGALWSNTDDLQNYLIMLLKDGVAPNGQQVISPKNLAYIWKPQVDIDGNMSYGLGWDVEDYQGLTVIHHPGGTAGFASELVVIPDMQIGFALLSNRMDFNRPLGRMATYRLLEMLTGSEQVYDQQVRKMAQELDRQTQALLQATRETVEPAEIAPFLGSYHNNELGEIRLVLHDDHTLWIDFGEYESPIRPLVSAENRYIFFESVFIGKTIAMEIRSDGVATIKWSGSEGSYELTADRQ